MTRYLDDWYQRKCTRRTLSIKAARISRFRHYACLGPRGRFAVVQIRGEPASEFSFESLAVWPCPQGDYTTAVLDGVLDELFASDLGHVVAKVQFTLEAIEWHDVDSSAVAFYFAARGAVREILGLDDYYDYNVELPSPK